ncbi:MAG TPA: hypothetical protein VFR67_18325 [Pilimelia sp.]|nr:hypothetical protein [Pilimelia sp.]
MARGRWKVWIAVVATALLGGCGPGGNGAGNSGAPDGEGMDRMRQQAREALARYDKAILDAGDRPHFVPVGELTGQIGDWEPDKGDNKAALMSGRIVAAAALPTAPQPTGKVTWKSGATQTFRLISADEALRQLAAAGAGDCPHCTPLQVTGARLATAQIETTRGPATAPAWEYTLKGTAVRVTRVAVAASAAITVTPPPWDPYNAPGGLAIESATTAATNKRLTVVFTGAPGPGSEPCGADYSAEAVESANAVVVIVITHPHAADETCTAIGARRTTTVELARPLGERAVLEVQQGLPVPVTITP